MATKHIDVELDGGKLGPLTLDDLFHSEVNLVMSMAQLLECATGFATLGKTGLAYPTPVVKLGEDIMRLATKILLAVKK